MKLIFQALQQAHKLLYVPVFAAVTLFALVTPAAQAAIGTVDAAVTPEKASNPKPDAHDIVLPMPCGLSMTLRPVAVPGGLTHDRRFTMGVAAVEERRQIYERRFDGHIAAPFTVADLPASWLQKLEPGTANGYTFYFMGKYEISQWQWDAVMQEQCPATPPTGGDLPKREISWFDAQAFLQKYNAWLVANHSASLPHFAGNERSIGFFRLPTEEEWEFAARGGNKVREEDRDNNDIFPLNGGRLEDFGVFTSQSPAHEPQPIGSRQPNPLGLYDTVGNVKEMVDGFFQLSVADMRAGGEVYRRRHGSAGGVLCKGGSFSSESGEVLPGWRDEVPLYTSAGESKPSDLGFRLALAGLNVPSAQRMQALISADAGAAKEQQPAAVSVDTAGDPLTELDRLAKTATPEMRSNLDKVRGMLHDRLSAQERQRVEVLENTLRSQLYQAETMRGFAFRYSYLHGELQKYLDKHKDEDTSAARKKMQPQMDEFYQLLLTAANYYKSTLKRTSGTKQAELDRILHQFRQEYSADDTLSKHMKENIGTLEKHLKIARDKGVDTLTQKQICQDILPAGHIKVLQLK